MKRMSTIRALALACATVATQALAQAPAPPAIQAAPPPGMSQGELLYTTHCVACHTTEIHWRDKKLVKDWRALIAQVGRWQANGNLNWGEEEIVAVAHYLNGTFYHLQEPEEKKIGDSPSGKRVARRD
jgi:mono/diheme cytochrome c family protein